jgi:hypothetical protein
MYFGDLDSRTIHILSAITILFVMPSVIQSFAMHDTVARDTFVSKSRKKYSFREAILQTVCSAEFICETLLFLFLIAVLPTLPIDLGFSNITKAIMYEKMISPEEEKLLICAVTFPFVIMAEIIVRTWVKRDWFMQYCLAKEKPLGIIKSIFSLCLRLGSIMFIYAIGFMMIPLYLGNAPAAFLIIKSILPVLIAAVIIVWIFSYISAYNSRKRFIHELKKLCRENDFSLSEIKKPFSFIFACIGGYNFTVEAHGKKYDCKFLSGIHKNAPVMFDLFGAGVWIHYFRIRGKELFKYVHRFEYAFESENHKILIISPTPREMFLGENMHRRRVDTGDSIGEYKLFNENGFLRSLELGVLDAKGKFE